MKERTAADDRELLRSLLSRPFRSTQEASAEICRTVRRALDIDLVYAARFIDGDIEFIAIDTVMDLPFFPGMRMPMDATLCNLAVHGEAPRFCPDLANSPYADLELLKRFEFRSFAMTPLSDRAGAFTGSLSGLDRNPWALGDDDLGLFEVLGGVLTREQELDLMRRQEAERSEALNDSEDRYRTLVDNMTDIVVSIDAGGLITYINKAWEVATGIPAADMIGTSAMDRVHPEDREMAAAHMAEIASGGNSQRVARFLTANGAERWMSVRGQPVITPDGDFGGFAGVIHDVTHQIESDRKVHAALAEAEEARDEAQRASLAKSEFLSRMSHELRTPLNAILGFTQLLELGELVDEDAENVDQISKAGKHLLSLINEVLDVVRIEAGHLQLSLEPVALAATIQECIDLVRVQARERDISLSTEGLDGVSAIADHQRLKQVVLNLLSNAVKYNRAGGTVRIHADVRRGSAAAADEADSTTAGTVRISVTDTGTGIPADKLDDVFTPFDRLGAEASDIEGTGVGLSLTKTLVEAQGGSIGCTSEVGVGSTFWIDVPLADRVDKMAATPEMADDENDDAGTDEQAPSASVLYVEDNPSNIMLMRRILGRRPHIRLDVVSDGAEAVELVPTLDADLVLLDLHLPGVTGSGVLEAIRSNGDDRIANLPVVIVTADLSTGNERRMLEAGATRFMSKPIDIAGLLAVVDEFAPVPSPDRQVVLT